MRKSAIIFLIALFMLPLAGSYLWLNIEVVRVRKDVKRQMMKELNDEDKISLTFQKTEIGKHTRWEHAKEFEFNGEMYDIVSFRIEGDYITYYCWWDNEETQLNQKLKSIANKAVGADPIHHKKKERVKDAFKVYWHEEQIILSGFPDKWISPSVCRDDHFVAMPYFDVLVPPPEI